MDALLRLGLTLVQSGQADEGLEALEGCIQRCRQGGLGLLLYNAMGAKALALTTLGRKEEAIALGDAVAIQGAQRALPNLRALAFIPYTHFALLEARLDEARQRGLAVAHLGEEAGNPFMELTGYMTALRAGDKSREILAKAAGLLDLIDANCRAEELRPFAEKSLAEYRALLA
jgi:hypothetical protein